MTTDELDAIVDMLRECQKDANASEGDYYADQFAFHGGGEAADAIEWLRAEIARLRLAIRRLAEQDATLSVQGGNVTVTMDATLTDAEREALEWAGGNDWWTNRNTPTGERHAATLRGLLERLK